MSARIKNQSTSTHKTSSDVHCTFEYIHSCLFGIWPIVLINNLQNEIFRASQKLLHAMGNGFICTAATLSRIYFQMIFEYYYCVQFYFDYARTHFLRIEWNTNACCWNCAYIYQTIKAFASSRN